MNRTLCSMSLQATTTVFRKAAWRRRCRHTKLRPSLDEYLKQRHARKVAELQEHLRHPEKVWFEQIITQDVVDFVGGEPGDTSLR